MPTEKIIDEVYKLGRFLKIKGYDQSTSWEIGKECRELLDKLPMLLKHYKGQKSLIKSISAQQKDEKDYEIFFNEWKYLWKKYPLLDKEACHYAKIAESITWKTVFGTEYTHNYTEGRGFSVCAITDEANDSGIFDLATNMYFGTICLYYRFFLSPTARNYGEYCFRWFKEEGKEVKN